MRSGHAITPYWRGRHGSVHAAQRVLTLTQLTHRFDRFHSSPRRFRSGIPSYQCRQFGHVVHGMVTFAPPTASNRRKLDDRVQRHLDRHALFHPRVAEIGHEALENAHVADHKCGNDLLFDINHDTGQARHQVFVTFSAGKTVCRREKEESVNHSQRNCKDTLYSTIYH